MASFRTQEQLKIDREQPPAKCESQEPSTRTPEKEFLTKLDTEKVASNKPAKTNAEYTIINSEKSTASYLFKNYTCTL